MTDCSHEIDQLKKRISKLEKELKEKQPIRVDRIEYRVDRLYVESISNGVLDLGVHFASDIQIAVPRSTGTTDTGKTDPSGTEKTDPSGTDWSEADDFEVDGQDASGKVGQKFHSKHVNPMSYVTKTNGISEELEWLSERLDSIEALLAEWEVWKSSVDERLCKLEQEH